MKVKYTGPNIGVFTLTNGKIYEVTEIDYLSGQAPLIRVRDDDENDFNYNNDPDWKPGYLYSPTAPGTLNGKLTGKWEIVEDDEQGTLDKLINPR
ncbi:MAG: hypothetical protein LBL34_01470 [Clostridiales bacterium]|jgi:hypothetical protein|nr:hypothetical protein [Clostridiales bacterium]